MKTFILILNFWFFLESNEPQEFCDIVNSLIAKEKLESVVQHASNLLGKCVVIYETKNIKDKFNIGIGDYDCNAYRVVVFSDAEIFGHKIEKGIQFDKIKLRKGKVDITYSIIEFYLDGKPGGLKRKTITTKRAHLVKADTGYR